MRWVVLAVLVAGSVRADSISLRTEEAEELRGELVAGTLLVKHHGHFAGGRYEISLVYGAEVVGAPEVYGERRLTLKLSRTVLFSGESGENQPIVLSPSRCGVADARDDDLLDVSYSFSTVFPFDKQAPKSARDFVWSAKNVLPRDADHLETLSDEAVGQIVACARKRVDSRRLIQVRKAWRPLSSNRAKLYKFTGGGWAWSVNDLAPQLAGHFMFVNGAFSVGEMTPELFTGFVHVRDAAAQPDGGILLSLVPLVGAAEDESGFSPTVQVSLAHCERKIPSASLTVSAETFLSSSSEFFDDDGKILGVHARNSSLEQIGVAKEPTLKNLKSCLQRVERKAAAFPFERITVRNNQDFNIAPQWELTYNTGVEHKVEFDTIADWSPREFVLEPKKGVDISTFVVERQQTVGVGCGEHVVAVGWGAEMLDSAWVPLRRTGLTFTPVGEPPVPELRAGWEKRLSKVLPREQRRECGPTVFIVRYRIRAGATVLKQFTFYPPQGC